MIFQSDLVSKMTPITSDRYNCGQTLVDALHLGIIKLVTEMQLALFDHSPGSICSARIRPIDSQLDHSLMFAEGTAMTCNAHKLSS